MPVPPTSRYFHVASNARAVRLKCSSGTVISVAATAACVPAATRTPRWRRAAGWRRERFLSFAQRSQFSRVERVELALDAVHDDADDENCDGEVEQNPRFHQQRRRVNEQQTEQVN